MSSDVMDEKWSSGKGVSQAVRNFVILCLPVSHFAFFKIKKPGFDAVSMFTKEKTMFKNGFVFFQNLKKKVFEMFSLLTTTFRFSFSFKLNQKKNNVFGARSYSNYLSEKCKKLCFLGAPWLITREWLKFFWWFFLHLKPQSPFFRYLIKN